MRTVVIGGQGFIGAEIAKTLLRRGDDVTIADRAADRSRCDALFGAGSVLARSIDILDKAALRRVMRGADEVYHMAGKLGTSELDDQMITGIEINIAGAVNVFEACLAAGVPNVFYPSKPNVWLNAYSITKFASEQFARLYSETRDIRICSLRYFNAYGPNQATGPVRKIIPTFALQASRGLPVEIFGDGEQVVDMIFARDLGRISVDFMRSSYKGPPVDCGRGIPMTVNQVAADVNRHFENQGGVKYLPMRRGETPCTTLVADIAPLRRVLGRLKFSDWRSSLASTLDWYSALDDSVIYSIPKVLTVAG
ncbi:MAG TPA: NAD(P)-dependent oxidoreductase [Bryobacteraceae bacterium]|nr:NAD(P)-dependent oxidoreductase [Bryobacteraceae bacterium]